MTKLNTVDRAQRPYRCHRGLPPKFHARLKHEGRTLAVLQGDTPEEAMGRAEQLVEAFSLNRSAVSIEDA
ncbi:hypothetical protein CXK96_16915 [Stutzerimonas stutzeri]|nr:hypothetical protein CXK96_16915 [Stutzerimonas stutzeri]